MNRIKSTIMDVSWERIYMTVKLNFEEVIPPNTRYFLCNESKVIFAELFPVAVDEFTVYLHLNITNNGLNRCIQNGNYKLYATDSDSFYSIAGYEGNHEVFGLWGRSFPYLSNKGVYTVSFLLDEYAADSEVQFLIYNAVTRKICNYPRIFGKDILKRWKMSDALETSILGSKT